MNCTEKEKRDYISIQVEYIFNLLFWVIMVVWFTTSHMYITFALFIYRIFVNLFIS